MRVDLEEVVGMEARKNQINKAELKDIEFFKDGKKVEVPPDVIAHWKYTGLSNMWFAVDISDGQMPDFDPPLKDNGPPV